MNPVRKRRLLIILFSSCILAVAAALILYALRQNINLFYSPTQIAAGEAPLARAIRAGGMVAKDSLLRGEGLNVTFQITDFKKTVAVTYNGILPDLFREGQGIVVEGQLIDNHTIEASQVLAKHDANYMPPEVKATLADKGDS